MPGLKWIIQAVLERIFPHKYNPGKYWEKRLRDNFNLIGVGNRRYSEEKNREMYDVKKNILSGMLKNMNIDITGKKVLEIGCGVGYWTEYCMDKKCADYVGIDISETAVRSLQEKYPDYRFISGDVSELKMDERFDIVLMIDVTQHIVDDKKFKKSMEFVKSSLEKNGHFLVTSWLQNKVRDKYYEKSRGIEYYKDIFTDYSFSEPVAFNDKYLMVLSSRAEQYNKKQAVGVYIGHITYDDVSNPWCGGGGAKRVFEVDRRLGKKHRIKVFTGNFPGAKDEIIDSVEYKRIGIGLNYLISRITFSLCLPFYLFLEKFDIIVNEFSAYAPSFFINKNSKKIIAIHHLIGKSPLRKYSIFGIFPYLFERIAGGLYKYIITVSPSVTSIIKERYKKDKAYRLIYNGVSNDLFTVVPQEENYIGFLGRIDVYMKGLDTLLEAFSKIKNRDVFLKLAGSGTDKDLRELRSLSEKLKISDRVIFLGRISDEEKKDFLGSALYIVMPSRFEGWGIAAIEASACSRAVIGADIPGLRDAVIDGKTGVLVKPENSDSLAEAMDKLLDNKEEREQFGINGREYAGKFDWDVITNEHEQFYLEVLENNKL